MSDNNFWLLVALSAHCFYTAQCFVQAHLEHRLFVPDRRVEQNERRSLDHCRRTADAQRTSRRTGGLERFAGKLQKGRAT